MPDRNKIISIIAKTTGFTPPFAIDSITEARADEAQIPFLNKSLENRVGIKVALTPGKLNLGPSGVPSGDKYERRFVVLLDAAANTVLNVRSIFAGDATEMRAEPSPSEAERQLRLDYESYISFPKEAPTVTLLHALEVVSSQGVGDPYSAKEIDAWYINFSRKNSTPTPTWVITMRGLPPFISKRNRPERERNHMRNMVDAITGKFLYASNGPHPL